MRDHFTNIHCHLDFLPLNKHEIESLALIAWFKV